MKPAEAIQRTQDLIRLRHMSYQTEQCYLAWLRRFIRFLCDRRPEGSPARKMEAFLTQLAKQECAAATQNQAFNALLFFYREVLKQDVGKVNSLRAIRPAQIRTAPTVEQVRDILARTQDTGGYRTRLVVQMLYGMGLRVSEPLNLRLKDVLLSEQRLIIRGAKGGKDRVVAVPCCLFVELQAQLALARGVAERDRSAGVPIKLPGLLAAKYPREQFAPGWAWLFPAHVPCRDKRTGQIVRYRMHEVNVQRCVKAAAAPLGLSITPHHLRHAYATHSLNRGVNVKALQESMGHAEVETTLGYCHAEACSVPSPLALVLPC